MGPTFYHNCQRFRWKIIFLFSQISAMTSKVYRVTVCNTHDLVFIHQLIQLLFIVHNTQRCVKHICSRFLCVAAQKFRTHVTWISNITHHKRRCHRIVARCEFLMIASLTSLLSTWYNRSYCLFYICLTANYDNFLISLFNIKSSKASTYLWMLEFWGKWWDFKCSVKNLGAKKIR